MALPATLDSLAPARRTTPGGPWGFWGTTLWGIAAVAVLLAAGLTMVLTASWWLPSALGLSGDSARMFFVRHSALLIGLPAAPALAVLVLATWLSRMGIRNYLGLILPRRREVMMAIAAALLLEAFFALADILSGRPLMSQWFLELYRRALVADGMPEFVLAVIVLYPIAEEALFRGFLLPGWAASRLGPACAILLTSALWTAAHTQYDLRDLVEIFCLGVLFGWLRQNSGSTLLTLLLHGLQNTAALVAVAIHVWPQ